MSNRRRRRRRNPIHDLLAKHGLADLLALPAVEVADAPRPSRPPRLADVGLPNDRDWRRETRMAIAPGRCDGQQQ